MALQTHCALVVHSPGVLVCPQTNVWPATRSKLQACFSAGWSSACRPVGVHATHARPRGCGAITARAPSPVPPRFSRHPPSWLHLFTRSTSVPIPYYPRHCFFLFPWLAFPSRWVVVLVHAVIASRGPRPSTRFFFFFFFFLFLRSLVSRHDCGHGHQQRPRCCGSAVTSARPTSPPVLPRESATNRRH